MNIAQRTLASVALAAGCIAQTAQPPAPAAPPDNSKLTIPELRPLQVPQRIGILGETKITLKEALERVLANDRDLQISRIAREVAGYNVTAARGYFDPAFGINAYRTKSVTPIASLIGGAANGKLTQTEWLADPRISGVWPKFGGSYQLDLSNARQTSDSQFITLNPQYPTAANLRLTQPLWRGLRFDENRHRLQVAKKNQQLTDAQFRQRVIEITTQAIQAYWDLQWAWQNLNVQLEAVSLAERQFESNRRQAEQGLLAPVDVVQAQTQVATYQQNVFAAQQALTQAENNLKSLMLPTREDTMWGIALIPETQVDVNTPLPTLQDALQTALKGRPELTENAINVEINRLDARLSQELARPQIDVYANLTANGLAGRPLPPAPNPFTGGTQALIDRLNILSTAAGLPPIPPISFGSNQVPSIFVGSYGQSISNLGGLNFPTAQVGLQINFPIRNRTANANAAVAAAEGRRLQAVKQQVEMAVEADVRNSLQSAASARRRLDAATLARQSAEEQYASEQRQFQAGTSTVFLVFQRQTEFITARSQEVRARADLAQALAALERATSTTIEAQGLTVRQ